MTEYIIHADDFGKDASVTACIDECFLKGWLSETSLMVNMPSCVAAVDLARRNGYAHRVGVHINLTEGKPLTESIARMPRFCNADGTFNKAFHFSSRTRFFLTNEENRALHEELKAQLRTFCGYPGLMKRIDSHHHVHTDWSVYRILKPLALEFGFEAMRISADLHKVRFDKELYKRFFNRNVRGCFATTNHFDGINADLLRGPSGSVEVMVHPLMRDGVLCDSRYPYETQIEKLKAVPHSIIRGA